MGFDLDLAVRLGVKDIAAFKSALRAAGAEVDRFGRLRDRRGRFVSGGFAALGPEFAGLGGKGKKPPELGKRISEFGSNMSSAGRSMRNYAAVTGFALAGLAKPALDYEKAIVDAVAVTGDALGDLTGKNEKRLRGLTREFTSLGYAAEEVAQAVGFMGMAGMNTNQIMASMGPTLKLAKAGSLDVARTTDLLTDVTTSFGLKMGSTKEATESMNRAADVLTYTFTSANTTLEFAARSMFAIGANAPQMGVSLESMAGAVGQLGSAGIKAEKAGTAMRNILLRLANPKGPAQDMFAALNLKPKVLTDALARDDLAGMFSILNQAIAKKGWTGAKRTKAIDTIFGNRQTTVASYLMEKSMTDESGTSSLSRQIEATRNSGGLTESIAARKAASDAAKVAAMKAELEQMQIDLGTKVLPGLLPVAREIVDSLKSVGDYAAKNPEMVASLVKWAATFAAVSFVAGPAIQLLGGMVGITGRMVSMANAGRQAANAASAGASALGAAGSAAAGAAGGVSKFRAALGAAPLYLSVATAVGALSYELGSFADKALGISDHLSGINKFMLGDQRRAEQRGAAPLTKEEHAKIKQIDDELAAIKQDPESDIVWSMSDSGQLTGKSRTSGLEQQRLAITEAARLRGEKEAKNREEFLPKLHERAAEIDQMKKELNTDYESAWQMKGTVGGRSKRDRAKTATLAELEKRRSRIATMDLAGQMAASRAGIGMDENVNWRTFLKVEKDKEKRIALSIKIGDEPTKNLNPAAGLLEL